MLRLHIFSDHMMRQVKCDQCNFTSGTYQELDSHKIKIHKWGMDIQCLKCNKSFKSRDQLVTHVKAVHLKMHGCNICDKSLGSKHALESHIKVKHALASKIEKTKNKV